MAASWSWFLEKRGRSDELTGRADRRGDEQGGGDKGAEQRNRDVLDAGEIEGHCASPSFGRRTIRRMPGEVQGPCQTARIAVFSRFPPVVSEKGRKSRQYDWRKLLNLGSPYSIR